MWLAFGLASGRSWRERPGRRRPGSGGRRACWLALERLEDRTVPSFLAPVSYDAGTLPQSVAVGDFNGDDNPDLAMAGGYPLGTVSVLLGNGDGSFQPAQNYAAGSVPLSVAVGDFNADGKQDLAVANDIPYGTVSVLLGNGDGSFQPARSYAAGSEPRSVAVGDFNADGNLDLAVAGWQYIPYANCQDNAVRILLGNGDGSFQAPQSYAAGTCPQAVAVEDFNGDGNLDLAVANNLASGRVSVLLGNGDGSFQQAQSYAAGNTAVSVTVGDFNDDGKQDLAVPGGPFPGTVSVLLGNGDGSFQPAQSYPAGALSVAVGDFNGDGNQDLALANHWSNAVSVLLGNGDGSFQPGQSYAAGREPTSVAVGDFNGDGFPDLAVANNIPSGTVSVLLNAADDAAYFYVYAPESVVAGQPFDLAAFALSGTGLLAHGYRGTVAFFSTDAAATLPEPYRFQAADRGVVVFPGGGTLRTPGPQVILALDLETATVFGFAFVDVLAPSAGGGVPGLTRVDLSADLYLAARGRGRIEGTVEGVLHALNHPGRSDETPALSLVREERTSGPAGLNLIPRPDSAARSVVDRFFGAPWGFLSWDPVVNELAGRAGPRGQGREQPPPAAQNPVAF